MSRRLFVLSALVGLAAAAGIWLKISRGNLDHTVNGPGNMTAKVNVLGRKLVGWAMQSLCQVSPDLLTGRIDEDVDRELARCLNILDSWTLRNADPGLSDDSLRAFRDAKTPYRRIVAAWTMYSDLRALASKSPKSEAQAAALRQEFWQLHESVQDRLD